MARLIDAEALKTRINNVPMHGDHEAFYDIMSELVSVVASAPTVAAEIVRHGRWINNGWEDDDGKYHRAGYKCSECAGKSVITYPNCPWCRAKMDAKEEENG